MIRQIRSGELVLDYWETPEPKNKYKAIEHEGVDNTWNEVVESNPYKKWLLSKKTVQVHLDSMLPIKKELFENPNVSSNLIIGISCDYLKDQIEIKAFKMSKITHNRFGRSEAHPFYNDFEMIDYAVLKTIESEHGTRINFDEFKNVFDESFNKVTPQEFIQKMENLGYKFKQLT